MELNKNSTTDDFSVVQNKLYKSDFNLLLEEVKKQGSKKIK